MILKIDDGWAFSLFGRKGTPYDFDAVDVGQLKEKARELEDTQKGMKKKVNPKVINMLDRYACCALRIVELRYGFL